MLWSTVCRICNYVYIQKVKTRSQNGNLWQITTGQEGPPCPVAELVINLKSPSLFILEFNIDKQLHIDSLKIYPVRLHFFVFDCDRFFLSFLRIFHVNYLPVSTVPL